MTKSQFNKDTYDHFEENPLYDSAPKNFEESGEENTLGVIPRSVYRKALDEDTVILGGKALGEVIVRRIHGESLLMWIKALESNEWYEQGFSHTPVEPIVTKNNSYRIYSDKQSSYAQVPPGEIQAKHVYRVYTRVLGPTLEQLYSEGPKQKTPPPQVTSQVNAIEEVVYNKLDGKYTREEWHATHFDLHNICVHANTQDESDSPLRLYLIDWDLAFQSRSWLSKIRHWLLPFG